MFSGIVEEIGAIQGINKSLAGAKFFILASVTLEDLKLGDSISVAGACLTASQVSDTGFSVDVSTETLNCTTLGTITVGTPVNLERAMTLNARIGGHLVTGHIDGIGLLRARQQDGNSIQLTIEAPEEIIRYCVPKGSITVDGISLTINAVSNRSIAVAIIPHTAKVTTMGLKQIGDTVNLESDLIGKYVERLLQSSGALSPKPATVIDRDYLEKRGLL
ncbi:riboflavin synthase [Candidatus Nitrospira neomarina]|uniref:Riboflavin synthase n=1 Tax=Candidatus Nitrospira neomarina TaxID=3020899 RepID=A0AA96GQ36_9BACT|nr:riboflavin synthase [Candidatus Nitrospira neomarina]WNM63288.1 riboflavin synthase [Candidatus Nitrospira neomarina]